MKEKRNYKRYRIQLPAEYKVLGSPSAVFSSTTVDISAAGFCFMVDRKIDVDREVELRIQLEDQGIVDVVTEVVWARPQDGKYKIGVKIVDANHEDDDKFIRFYCEKIFLQPQEEED